MVDPARAVCIGPPYLHGMATVPDRVEERRRTVQLARHYREAEGLSIAQIAQRLGRSPATVKAYFYDPTGEKAKAVKARYQGVCRGCGAPTQPRNGKGDAYAHCKRCHPGAIAPQWTRERVRDAMRAWRDRYGEPPSSYDWSRTHARRRGGQALERLAEGDWPSPTTVTDLHETWAAARADAFESGPSPPQSRRVLRSAERRPHRSRAGMRPPRERS
jgi:AraC-like DNA-binding protein